jgi:phosphohistidine swiveling domain-containing protein
VSGLTRPVNASVGAKAAMLRRLSQAGFRVPKFVVTPVEGAEALDELGGPVAVRSSADVEDGDDTSFAGQFESFLNLSTAVEVDEAIAQCRASAHSPSVVSYCLRNGIDPDTVRVEAIIQRMVQPELAGVAFTINPVTGAEEVVIEACEGLADRLMSGKQEPLSAGHELLERYRSKITAEVLEVQRFLGAPQDVEFAVENGELFILQSRPVTRIGFSGQPGEWTNADFRDGGVSSSVCSPLMWSLYEFVWDRTLKDSLRELRLFREDFPAGRMFFGRPYWNVGAVKECLAPLPGFTERDFDNDLSIEITYDGLGRKTPVTVRGLWKALPTLLALPGYFRRQKEFDTAFLNGGFDEIARRFERWNDSPAAALRQLLEHEFFLTESNYFRTIFATSLARMDFTGSFPATDCGALVAALPPLRHMMPVRAVEQLSSRDDASLDAAIHRYAHHCRLGLDIRFPRWDEDYEFVREMLRTMPASSGRTKTQQSVYDRARGEALEKLPWRKRRSFRRKLERLRTFVWLREEMRDLSSQMYALMRRFVMQIGEERGIGDDVFFMTFRQLLEDDRSRVEQNRAIYDSYRNFKAPNEIGDRYRSEQRDAAISSVLSGIGASPGTATGIVCVARTVQEALAIPTNAILVCPFTDPGWTPVLDRVSGVVTETGGFLSHAAVICREYGIPAVLGVPQATRRIPAGSRLVVNGHLGQVEVL